MQSAKIANKIKFLNFIIPNKLMQSKTIIDLLSNETFRKFIGLHLKEDVKKLALNAKKYTGIDIKAASALISLYQKAELKLPEHYKALAALNNKSYEQSTSEAVAKYKAQIMQIENKCIINITGGLGIDDWAMANYALKIDSCETDVVIHNVGVYNSNLFNNTNITRHFIDGIAFVKNYDPVNIIYADPDRRPNSGRMFRLEDSEPDVLSNMPLLLGKASEVWIKISPMADISYLQRSFPSLNKLYVIAWLGEVKEILICCTKIKTDEIKTVAVNITPKQIYTYEKPKIVILPRYNNFGKYLYEPNRAIIKAGLSAEYSQTTGLPMLSSKSNFFISDKRYIPFQGRAFEIIERIHYKPRFIETYLKTQKIVQANITIRNFRETTEQLRKRFGLKDGGNDYLCFTTDTAGESWLFHCKQF